MAQITKAEQAMRNNGYDPFNDNGYKEMFFACMKQAITDFAGADNKGTFMDRYFVEESVEVDDE